MSRPYAEVIGDPVAHSKSPVIHGFWLDKLGIDADYRKCHVRPDELADYFATRRRDPAWRGCNVTVPHKEKAARLVDELMPGYPDIGAVNLIINRTGLMFGGNTDLDGVAGPINEFHDRAFNFGRVPPRKVGVIGAGGAARAALFALKAFGWLGELRLLVRNIDKGEALLGELGLVGAAVEISDRNLSGLNILINASTMGMGQTGDGELTLDSLDGGGIPALVFDMVYHPPETGLLRAARRQGHSVIDGLQMLVSQADSAFGHLFEEKAPRAHDAELRGLLTS